MKQTHSLLKRQLKQHFGGLDSLPKEWQGFIEAVNNAYWESDTDRGMLERSLDLSSQELLQANSEMRAVFQAFPDLFFRLDAEGKILDYKAGSTTDLYLPPEKLLGKRMQDIPLEDVGNKFHEAIQQVQETKSLVSIEYSLTIQNREYFYEARLLSLLENQFIVIVRNITERKRAEEEIRKFKTISDRASYGSAISDLEGNLIYINESFAQMHGYTPGELIGKNLSVFHNEEQMKNVERLNKQLVQKGSYVAEEVWHKRKDSTVFPTLMTATVIKDEKEKPLLLAATATDITERKRSEEKLRKAKEQAEEANQLKSEFLTNMSHEIRTPMNAIIGMTGITLDTDLTEEQREYLDIVKESGYALLGLIDDILDLSKIEAGGVKVETIDFDLRTTIEGVADTLAARASTKGLELACMIHRGVPTLLRGDPGRLRQVLMNLGGNAVKFTEKGEVVIRAEVLEETKEQAALLFSVTDTGVGIFKDKQKKIFESFTQADGSATREYGGTGLGLSISKRLVELLGGQIGVESQPEKGSRFWFTITFEKQKGFKEILLTLPPDIRGMRMLVVDDNKTNRTILIKMLESFGCCAEAAESGAKALQVLKKAAHKEKLFDLVLLDMQMPEIDGEQTLRSIKDNPEIKDVTVIIVASVGVGAVTSRLEDLGCAGYLMKPVKQSQLFDTIITVLSQHKNKVREKPIPIVTRHIVEEQKRRAVRILLAEDNPMNQKFAITLLKKAGYGVDAVGNGRMVIEVLKQRDYDLILMDVQMPQMNGFEATKAIREREGESKHTPIIAMTAHAMKGDREQCLQAGMDDYIAKPIEPQELFDAIEKWVKSSDRNRATPREGDSKKGNLLKAIPIDLKTTLKRFGGDKEFFKKMLGEFLNSVPKQLEKLAEAIEKGDEGVVEKEAHSVKGAAGNLGAEAFAQVALQLEILVRKKDLTGAKALLSDLKAELKHLEEYFKQSFKEKIALKS
jgi:two-component system sensor histidine kinase/response regulator